MGIYPFSNPNFDKSVNSTINPLDDKFGWDRVKDIFYLRYIYFIYYPIVYLYYRNNFSFYVVQLLLQITFFYREDGTFTKELASIINITLSGAMFGIVWGGVSASKNTVNSFISSNEATRFTSHFDAKWHLQQAVSRNFIKKGLRMGRKVALFCCIFR